MGDGAHQPHLRVVVAGAGLAGMEAALAVEAFAEGLAHVTLVDPGRRFAPPATATGRAFGIAPPIDTPLPHIVGLTGASFRQSRLVAVDPRRRLAMLAGGELLVYDHLVIAVGGRAVPHLSSALTFRGHADADALGDLVSGMVAHAERGGAGDLAVVIPPGCGWPLAGYEIALMAREQLVAAGQGGRSRVEVVTAESTPLAMFEPSAGELVVQKLRRAGIGILCGEVASSFHWGRLTTAGGRVREVDRVVALATMRGPQLQGLPTDPLGFVRCDARGEVPGAPGVRVVGDAGTFPLKEGGVACHQADSVAADIAREHGAQVPALQFTPPLSEWLSENGGGGARWPAPKVRGRFLAPFLRDLASSPVRA